MRTVLQDTMGIQHIVVTRLASLRSVAGLTVDGLLLFLLLFLLLLLLLLELRLEAAWLGAHPLLMQVGLHDFEAGALVKPGVPLRVLGQVLFHGVGHMVVAGGALPRVVALAEEVLNMMVHVPARPGTASATSGSQLLMQEVLEHIRVIVLMEPHVPVGMCLDVRHSILDVPRALTVLFWSAAREREFTDKLVSIVCVGTLPAQQHCAHH
mmetsp:Transcript_92765/g.215583  ORF Transcript_92765/g.215583 Transcript_92765/m.215583 type:complete len:210 (-) Transcript_92765:199-828(-)